MDDTNTNPMVETPEEKAFFSDAAQAETAPVTTQTPEPAPEAKPEAREPAADTAGKTVPLAALLEERRRAQAAADRERALAERLEGLTAGFERVMSKVAPGDQTSQQDQIPALDDNPIAHFDARMRRYEAALADLAKTEQSRSQVNQQTEAVQRLITAYQADAAAFEAKTPDFKAAYEHLMTTRRNQLLAAGYDASTEVPVIMFREERDIVERAMRAGVSPAERLYTLAKHSNYQPKAASKPDLSAQNNAQRSLGAIAGSETGELTLEKLAVMSDDDFDKNWDKVMKQGRR